jgi:hypothetical protein
MSVTAKPLITAKYAQSAANIEYTAPANTRTIIDKFTATNNHSSSVDLTVYIIPAAGTASNANKVIKTLAIAAAATTDVTSLQNQILGAGEKISVFASVPDMLVIRASGRECT